MLRVIVNSTPLIALCNIGRLDLLRKVYGRIVIPQAVFDEVTEKDDSACRQIKQRPDWIEVKQISDNSQTGSSGTGFTGYSPRFIPQIVPQIRFIEVGRRWIRCLKLMQYALVYYIGLCAIGI